MSKLVLVEERSGTRHEVRPDDVIGRSGCDVVVDDAEISRNHARILSLDSGPAIEDLGSTNGTSLNGRKLTGIEGIRDGDELRLGTTVLRVKLEAAADATQVAPASERAEPVAASEPEPAPEPPARPEPIAPAPEPIATPEPPASAPASEPAAEASRGDVPAPAPASASRVHQAFSPPPAGAPASPFAAPGGADGARPSAATRVEATVAAYGVTLLTAIGVIAFLAAR